MTPNQASTRRLPISSAAYSGMLFSLILLASGAAAQSLGQAPGSYPTTAPVVSDQPLSPDQLDNLVAPIALYPDPLLSQVLAASTYPLELVQAQQWVQQNGNSQGPQLIEAAKRQNWDPSVQALVAFPDAIAMLNRDIQWTTALGNAFLAQQADVMNAIQRMRARAQSNGRLVNTPQQVVTSDVQNGQTAIEIQPANPQVIYVPSYNPEYVWGPPVYGAYPPMWYPPVSAGFGFGSAINLLSIFAGFAGLLTGGWGWILSWFTHSLFLNGLFFSHFGFHGGWGGGYGGFAAPSYAARSVWVHDPVHRLGLPYANRAVASRFGGTYRAAAYGPARAFGAGGGFSSNRTSAGSGRFNETGGWHSAANSGGFGRAEMNRGYSSFRSEGVYANNFAPRGPGFESNYGNRGFAAQGTGWNRPSAAAPSQTYARPAPGFNAPAQHFAPERFSAQNFGPQHFAQQRMSQPRAGHFSAPRGSQHFSAPHASAPHFSGSHSGGGHHSGGGSHGGSKRK